MSTEAIGGTHLLRIGDLARLTGKTVRAIHVYEEQGLLSPATRSSGGFRLYEPIAIERVRWIDSLHGLGFSLPEMRDVLRSWWAAKLGPEAMAQLRTLFQRKLDETKDAITRYQRLEHELHDGLRYLETCRECASPAGVKGCAHCTQNHGMLGEPSLVAGIVRHPERSRHANRPGFVRVEEIE